MFKKLIAMFLALYATFAMASADANKATHAELTGIKGIGTATATRILDARKEGPFKSWEDLIQRVKGIAEPSAAKLSAGGLTVNGQVFKPVTTPAEKAGTTNEKSSKPIQTVGKKAEKS